MIDDYVNYIRRKAHCRYQSILVEIVLASIIVNMGKGKITKVGIYHYIKLIVRIIIFMILVYYYIFHKVTDGIDIFNSSTITIM